jgi:hypothetical protein
MTVSRSCVRRRRTGFRAPLLTRHNMDVTEPPRPPKGTAIRGSLGWFAARNAAWGALVGGCISVVWMVISQDYWFAVHVILISAALSAAYGAICSVPAFLGGRRTADRAPLAVGAIFAGSAMAIQVGLIILVGAAPSFAWHSAAYAMLGGIVAVLAYRGTLVAVSLIVLCAGLVITAAGVIFALIFGGHAPITIAVLGVPVLLLAGSVFVIERAAPRAAVTISYASVAGG